MPAEFKMDMPEAGSPPTASVDHEVAEERPDGVEPSPAFHGNHVWEIDADDAAEASKPVAPPKQAEAKPAPAPEATPATDGGGVSLQELQRQLADTQEQVRNYEQRFRDTQAWANQQSMARSVAEGLVEAQQRQAYIQHQLQAQAAAARPPEIANPEDLLSDPKLLPKALQDYGEWGYRRAVGDLMPRLAWAESQLQRIQAAAPLVEYVARTRAKDALVAAGHVDVDQADKIIDRGLNEVIAHEAAAADYRLSPEAIVYAANIVLQRDGAPIKAKPKPVLSAGQGAPRATTPRKPTMSRNAEAAAQRAELMLGRKFTDEERAELARMNARV